MNKFIVFLMALFATSALANPQTLDDYKRASVQVTDLGSESGGSGTILKSTKSGSMILTNSHVCALTSEGGYVHSYKGKHAVQKILKSKDHDICLVYVTVNLGVNSTIADETPSAGDKINVSGFPFLLPHMLVPGHLSDMMQVTILTDVEECSAEDFKENEDLCYWFGGVPVIREYNAATTSALIAPGNSGSAVYNEAGEIVALVFAGTGRGMSPGILVPHEYLVSFMKDEVTSKAKWTTVAKGRKLTDLFSKKASKRSKNLPTKSLKDIIRLDILPASKDPKFDKVFNKILECKANARTCLRD